MGLDVRCTRPPHACCRDQAAVDWRHRPVDEPGGDTALVQPPGASASSEESRLRRHVGRQARRAARGHLGPARRRRASRAGVDQVVLHDAAADPVPLDRAAGRERPAAKRHGSPSGSATVNSPRAARSPPAETNPGAGSSARASSTVRDFTTPFRSSCTPGATRTSLPRISTEPATAGRGAPAGRVGVQQREVARIPRRLQRCADRRDDQAVRLVRGRERDTKCLGEHRGDGHQTAGRCVHPVQLAVVDEPAERPLALAEQTLDRFHLGRRSRLRRRRSCPSRRTGGGSRHASSRRWAAPAGARPPPPAAGSGGRRR